MGRIQHQLRDRDMMYQEDTYEILDSMPNVVEGIGNFVGIDDTNKDFMKVQITDIRNSTNGQVVFVGFIDFEIGTEVEITDSDGSQETIVVTDDNRYDAQKTLSIGLHESVLHKKPADIKDHLDRQVSMLNLNFDDSDTVNVHEDHFSLEVH